MGKNLKLSVVPTFHAWTSMATCSKLFIYLLRKFQGRDSSREDSLQPLLGKKTGKIA
jgi:hypothetical protein